VRIEIFRFGVVDSCAGERQEGESKHSSIHVYTRKPTHACYASSEHGHGYGLAHGQGVSSAHFSRGRLGVTCSKCYVLSLAALASRSESERLRVVATATYSERPCTLLCRLVLQREGILTVAHAYAAPRPLVSGSKTSTLTEETSTVDADTATSQALSPTPRRTQ